MSDRGESGIAAILIVAGGDDPRRFSWLDACLTSIEEHTRYPAHRVYVFNNDAGIAEADEVLSGRADRVLDADWKGVPHNPHAQGLQALFEAARADGARYVVTLDTDALAVRNGWLSELIDALDGGNALAGIWYQERPEWIDAYVHPSCLATTVDFVERHGLRFDELGAGDARAYDTASHLTETAVAGGSSIHKWTRSNRNELHPVLAGIYGDAVYHHGGGSRRFSPIHSPDGSEAARYQMIGRLGATMMLEQRREFLSWLRGGEADELIFVLGMHRSGTSALTGCLDACGVYLGAVERYSVNQPLGNLERMQAMLVNDALLESAGGAWDNPPDRQVSAADGERAAIDEIVAELTQHAPAALKDPRMLLTLDAWLPLVKAPRLIGSFRHPEAVARSLFERNRMPADVAYDLWRRYNERLIALHQESPFPLVEFDLSDRDEYCRVVTALAAQLHLTPRPASVQEFVQTGYRRTQVDASQPVPLSCQPAWEYLQEHRYVGQLEPGSFEARLLEWGAMLDTPTRLSPWRDFELWAWNVNRHLPRPLQVATLPLRRVVRRWRVRRETGIRHGRRD